MRRLESEGNEPSRVLRRVMMYVLDVLDADAAMVIRPDSDGNYERLQAVGILGELEVCDQLLRELPRPLPGDEALVAATSVVLPVDGYHLVVPTDEPEKVPADAIVLAESMARHGGQVIANCRLKEALVESESLSAVGKAMRRVLHDLRNPVSRIHVAVERASVPGTNTETLDRMHEIIAMSADDVVNIANEIIEFTNAAKLSRGQISAESLLATLRDRSGMMLAPARLRCAIDHPGAIDCDPLKLLHALTKLIENAFQEPGQATAADSGDDGLVLDLAITREGSDTLITMYRERFSIPDTVRSALFEPFAPDRKIRPKGLGLAIVRSIVRAHGGDITIASRGDESCFVMRLPKSVTNKRPSGYRPPPRVRHTRSS